MREDISAQLLSQVSENILKLSDLSTRIDERVKSIQCRQDEFDTRLADVIKANTELMQRLIVLEQTNGHTMRASVEEMGKDIINLDKRLAQIESTASRQETRWNHIFQFIVQLVWIVIACLVLVKLGLSDPQIP